MTVGPDGRPWGYQPNQGGPNTPWPAQEGRLGWDQNATLAAPPQQHPYGAWPPGPPPGPGNAFGPNRPNRKPLIIGLSVLAAVVLVIVVVSIVSLSGDESRSGGDIVKGYLNALARGDAATALSYSTDQPGSKDLLSDEVLKRQIARWPITNIRILNDSTHSFGFGHVHVAAKFGDTESDVTLSLKKSGGEWKLEHAAIKVDTIDVDLNNEALNTLTFFGRSVGRSPVYVFPGFIDAASSNPNLSVKMRKPFLLDGLESGSYFNDAEFTLSDSGQSEVMSAISAALAGCARSNRLSPAGCPQHAFDPDVVDGSVAWGTPDTSPITVQVFDQYRLEALLTGEVIFPFTAQTRSGGTKTGTVKAYVSAKADVSKSPPVVSVR